MKLSVELEMWRADRPDEWKMDEFIRNAEKLESERDALAAQVEALKSTLTRMRESYCRDPYKSTETERAEDGKLFAEVRNLIEISPQQHLRDVLAEAVCDFIEYMHSSKDCQLCSNSLDVASKYAASVKAGVA